MLNNPLSLTDPSGYLSFRQIIGIAIAVVAAYFGQYEISQNALGWAFAIEVAGGFLSAYVATGSFKAGLWGAFAAGIFFGIGSAFTPLQNAANGGFMGSGYTEGAFAAKVAAHAAAGGVLTTMQGGNFGSGFLAAGATEAASPAIDKIGNVPGRLVAAVAIGGTVSKLSGGKFANGAETALFQELFNQITHATIPHDVSSEEQARFAKCEGLCEQASAGLPWFRFGSQNDAASFFQDLANPTTAQTGFEVSAVIGHDSFGWYLENFHSDPYAGGGAVDVNEALGTFKYSAYVHTHPDNSMFSGAGSMYFNQSSGWAGDKSYGDIGVALKYGVDAYVSWPNGSLYQFNYKGFNAAIRAGQWTVAPPQFINQVH